MSWKIRIDEFRYDASQAPVLSDISFTIEPGRIHHICGPSGCGKTTLLGILDGQLSSREKQQVPYFFKGDLGNFPTNQARRSAQDPLMQIACSTVIDELLLAPEYREDTPENAVAKALESIKTYDLAHLADRDTSLLSFGQSRLLGLVCLLQYQTPVLLLDEPFVGLDARRQKEMLKVIHKISADGTAVVLTHTQNLPQAEYVIVNLHSGEKEESIDLIPPAFKVISSQSELSAQNLAWHGWMGGSTVSFTLKPGELLLLTGPNGAGKTQLLQHLAGLRSFRKGSVKFDGPITFVPQNPDQEIFSIDVLSEVMVGSTADQQEAKTLLTWFGLGDFINRSPLLLSYGQQKRISLIGGILRQPACLLLDEPFSGLDPLNRRRLMAILKYYLTCGGMAIIATHEPELFDSFSVPAARLHLDPDASREGFCYTSAPFSIRQSNASAKE